MKALYRRGKAHVGAWNPEQAKEDFLKAAELDTSLSKTVQREIKAVEEQEKKKTDEDRAKMAGLFR